jgi:hypothetical protein
MLDESTGRMSSCIFALSIFRFLMARFSYRSLLTALVLICASATATLLICTMARAYEYDAEADIGLIAQSQAAAKSNTERLTAALEAQWPGGKFKFANARVGAVLYPIRVAGKEFFFSGTIMTGRHVGGTVLGMAGRCWPTTSGGPIGGAITRFTRIDGEAGGAILRLRGNGFVVDGIEFRGRPYILDATGEGPSTGTKTPVGIEVEGHAPPATGLHVIRNCTIDECTYGICARAGYYDDLERFVAYENNADNSIVDGVVFFNCNSCFRSENQQAVAWSLRDITIGFWGGRGLSPVIVCDIVRGGDVWINGLSLNHPQATLFQVQDYSHNTQLLTCENLKWDHGEKPEYFTLFKYAGPNADLASKKWTVRISGHLGDSETKPSVDPEKMIDVPAGFPIDDIRVDVARLPVALKKRLDAASAKRTPTSPTNRNIVP